MKNILIKLEKELKLLEQQGKKGTSNWWRIAEDIDAIKYDL